MEFQEMIRHIYDSDEYKKAERKAIRESRIKNQYLISNLKHRERFKNINRRGIKK